MLGTPDCVPGVGQTAGGKGETREAIKEIRRDSESTSEQASAGEGHYKGNDISLGLD